MYIIHKHTYKYHAFIHALHNINAHNCEIYNIQCHLCIIIIIHALFNVHFTALYIYMLVFLMEIIIIILLL